MNTFLGFLFTLIYIFYYNDLYLSFEYSELFVFGGDKYFLTGVIFSIIILLIDILLMYLGRKLYNYKKCKFDVNYFVIFIYTYIFRFIPILCHIGPFLAGLNKKSFKKNLLFLISGFIFYIIIGYFLLSKIDYLGIYFN